MRLGFSHLQEHKFRYGFRDILNPLCPSSIETETTVHYFLRYHFYNTNRSALMNESNENDSSLPILNENKVIAFAWNAKSFSIAILVFVFFLLVTFSGQAGKSYFQSFVQLLLWAGVTRIGVNNMICRVLSTHVLEK